MMVSKRLFALAGLIVAVVLSLACGALTGGADTPPAQATIEGARNATDIVYKQAEGVDPSLLMLDVYSGPEMESAPVVVFIHGGTWTGGDKSNAHRSAKFLDFFRGNGAVVVSANIRLQQSDLSPNITYREQAADVASVVRWTRDHIAEYGGDPNRLALFGYSSGAHLVALVGADESYLRAEGLDRSALLAVMCFDVDAYDIPRAIAEGKDYGYPIAAVNLPKYFTSDMETQKAASPMTYVEAGHSYPAFLVVYTGYASDQVDKVMELSKRQAELFVEALVNAGARASLFGDLNLS
ncbi:MAG: alpha/beta hydrolase, partial [Chloroflexota bacterium]